MNPINQTIQLANDIRMPVLGFGTWHLKDGEIAYQAVLHALKCGFRHIDTAIVYQNEASVGRAIRDSGVPRDELFITGKQPPHIKHEKGVVRMFERSLKNLGIEYFDLYIINAPRPFGETEGDYFEENVTAYKALEQLYRDERVCAIGVSNFTERDLDNILSNCDIVPHVNQIGYFAGKTDDALVTYCNDKNIALQAYSPLGNGYLLPNPVVQQIAAENDMTPAQVCLAYVVQKGLAPITKASSIEHITSNAQVNQKLTSQQLSMLDALDEDPRVFD
mgnify:CR=1 FL=1